jgi:Mrp family chromosome partitioning ATPase
VRVRREGLRGALTIVLASTVGFAAGAAALALARERGTLGAALTGGLIGLVIGVLLALVREALDVRRTSSRSVAARLGIKQLGWVPEASGDVEDAFGPAPLEAPEGATAAAYASLAASVAREAQARSARVLLVCGTVGEDRGEQVAAALGAALATAGRKVAVVELDPGRPTLRREFALTRRPGVTELARGEATLDEALTEVPGVDGLAVLAAGAALPRASGSAETVLDALRERSDLVVVTGPPLLRDGAGLPPAADALLLAVDLSEIRHSRRPRLERSLGGLDMPVLGFVLLAPAGGVSRFSAPRA